MITNCNEDGFIKDFKEITGRRLQGLKGRWEGVVENLQKYQITPFEYLAYLRESNLPLEGNIINNNKYLQQYSTHLIKRKITNQNKLDWFIKQVSNRYKIGNTTCDILNDKQLDCYYVFKYILANIDNNIEYMDKVRKASIYELRIMPELRSIVSKVYGKEVLPC